MTDIESFPSEDTEATYTWGQRSYPVPAQVVGETIQAIIDREGACPPGRLVQEASKRGSPLHQIFTWDSRDAADQWRRHEARAIISSVRVRVAFTDDDEEREAPAFISVGHRKETAAMGGGYRPVSVVMKHPDFRREAIDDAIAQLVAIRRRHGSIASLAAIWDQIDLIDTRLPEE
jgi:hypothetical protein